VRRRAGTARWSAEHDGASLQQAINKESVFSGDIVPPHRIAERGWQARDIEGFLDRHRNTVQRSPALAAREGGIGSAGALSRLLHPPDNDCVERWVVALGARHVEVEQFDAPDAPIANSLRQPGCGCERAVVHSLAPSRPLTLHRSSWPSGSQWSELAHPGLIWGSVKVGRRTHQRLVTNAPFDFRGGECG
jgi:hypothetical protein